MNIRLAAGGLAGLVCGAALAQPPAVPLPATPDPVAVKPVDHTQTAQPPAWTADVSPGGKPADGSAAFPKAVADARAALGRLRDYSATMVRQELVNGSLLAEQTCALGVRPGKPAAVVVSVTAPKPLAGLTTSHVAGRGVLPVRQRAAGPDGTQPQKSLTLDDPAGRTASRYPVTGYGPQAVLDRLDAVVTAQTMQHRPTQFLTGDYTFAGRPVTRFEVFADRPTADGPRRLVVCFDAATKLPVRYEAYGPPAADAPGGAVLEVVSFLNVRLNPGLGDTAFER